MINKYDKRKNKAQEKIKKLEKIIANKNTKKHIKHKLKYGN